jgi:hypothetical protein
VPRPGAPLTVLDDETSLDGPRIDVGVRVGWVLRTARLTAGAGPGGRRLDRLSDMAACLAEHGVRTSAASLHRLETGVLRDSRLVEGYERVLGRPHGALRAPIDALCRTFPYGPDDRAAAVTHGGASSAAEMDVLHRTVSEESVGGSDWLRWARALSAPNALGLPFATARPLVRRLAGEMGRAYGDGYLTRYEALSLVRRSGYGVVVLDVAREIVADPHVQVLFDLMSAVGESAGHAVDRWLLATLDDERDHVVAGAVIGLENLVATSGGAQVWRRTVAEAVAAYNRREPGSEAWAWLSHLVRLMPPVARAAAERRLAHPLAPGPDVSGWSRSRVNEHWSMCEALAHPVTEGLGLPEQPLLTRMVFEIALGEQETRAVTSAMLLGALPAVIGDVCAALAEMAVDHPDPVVRSRTARRLAGARTGLVPASVRSWWREPGARQGNGLTMAGAAGVPVDERILLAAADRPETRQPALFAAGMTRHPVLRELVTSRTRCPEVRGGAAWWLAEGGRVPR